MTRTQLEQLLGYCVQAELDGTYYGNKEQFIARHKAIVKWIEAALAKEQT